MSRRVFALREVPGRRRGFERYIIRRFGPIGLAIVVLGIAMIFGFRHSAVGMSLVWIGCAVFCYTNYVAARRHELWYIGPGASAFGTLGCLMLAMTALIAGVAGRS